MAYTTFTDSQGTQITNYGYMNSIWNKLKSYGLSDESVAALMGNLYAESLCVPYIVQSNLTPPFSYSINYTTDVNNGTISEYDFVHNGPNGGGYGLAQWTYKTRKQGLYDYWQNGSYSSIGDYVLACDYIWYELNNGFTDTLNYLKNNSKTLQQKVDYVLKHYESPADQSASVSAQRYKYAHAILEYMQGTVVDPPDDGSGSGGGSGGGNAPPSTHKKIRFKVLRNPIYYT